MKMWCRNFICLVLSLVFCLNIQEAESFLDNEDEIERGDAYIDKLLEDMLEENGHEYEPYILEDSAIGFSKKIAFVNVSGEAKLHNGYITGLKSLHRPDHCIVEEKDGKLYVKADLGAGVLNLHYDGTVKFMNFGPTITVHGELAYVEIHMEFTVDAKTGRNGELKKFLIDDMKGMSVKVSGLGPVNFALNYLISGVSSVFKSFLRSMVEKKIRNHIAERLPKFQFPVEVTTVTSDTPETPEETPETETFVPETEEPEKVVSDTEESEEVVSKAPEVQEAFHRSSHLNL